MTLSDGLCSSLKEQLSWSKPRMACFANLLFALFRAQQMNLARLAVAMEGEADIQSRYRRLQRFFQQVHFDYDVIARLMMQMFGLIRVLFT